MYWQSFSGKKKKEEVLPIYLRIEGRWFGIGYFYLYSMKFFSFWHNLIFFLWKDQIF